MTRMTAKFTERNTTRPSFSYFGAQNCEYSRMLGRGEFLRVFFSIHSMLFNMATLTLIYTMSNRSAKKH